MKLLQGYTKQEKSWMLYDWANSAHSVIVVTILPIFYNTVAGYMADTASGMTTWGYATSIAMGVVALLAPVVLPAFLYLSFTIWKRLFSSKQSFFPKWPVAFEIITSFVSM